jgi:hygromycin-B 4-O-kinase
MSTHKTKIEESKAEEFINDYFGAGNIKLEPIGWGEESQAYYFSFDEKDYVLRLSKHGNLEYLKDQIVHREFSSNELPAPEVIDIGSVEDDLSFVITKRVLGKTLNEFSVDEVKSLNSDIVAVLAEIHKLKAPGEGYGGWGLNRNGPFKTWKEYLLASLEQDQEEAKLKEFYDESLHRSVKEEIRKMIPYCPEERSILHGDFGALNILSDGFRITGVIDWGDSLYGDPLKDVASWAERDGFIEEIKNYYGKNGGIPEYFDERIKCYKLLNAYGALWFYAYSDQEKSYKKCAENLTKLIEQPN